jgi:hypothetical protein
MDQGELRWLNWTDTLGNDGVVLFSFEWPLFSAAGPYVGRVGLCTERGQSWPDGRLPPDLFASSRPVMEAKRVKIKYQQGYDPALNEKLTAVAVALCGEFSDRPLGDGAREMSFEFGKDEDLREFFRIFKELLAEKEQITAKKISYQPQGLPGHRGGDMSENAKTLLVWVVMPIILGRGFYLWHEKSKPIPQPAKPAWSLEKYDSGKFYFSQDFVTKFRAVCESADCTPLLDHVQIGLMSLGDLNDVKREGLHLTVKQNGVEFHFKVEAMGNGIFRNEPWGKSNAPDYSQ